MHNEKLNNTKCDGLRKLMKQISFKEKNLGGTIPREQFTISNWDLQLRIPIRSKSNYSYQIEFWIP